MPKTIVLVALILLTAGCARSTPLISHAHVGHSLTAWHDTPNNQGLFVVAEQEAENALRELQLAKRNLATPVLAKVNVDNIVHSLNPDIQTRGSGLGYGAIRALQGATEHIEFAVATEDASENLRISGAEFDRHAKANLDQFLIALATARLAAGADSGELAGHLDELDGELNHCVYGKDLDRDGVIGNQPDESGLVQLRTMLSTMVGNEVSPPYHPIGRRYLLGLVRLPNGRWAYKFDRSGEGGGEGGSGSGGGGGTSY